MTVGDRRHKNLSTSSNKLLKHNSNFSPTLTSSLYKTSSLHSSHHSQATGIIYSGATYIYFYADAPIVNIDCSALKVTVGTATGQSQNSTGTGELNLPKPLWIPSHRAYHARVLTYLNRCRYAMLYRLYSHIHTCGCNSKGHTRHPSANRIA